MRIVVAGGAGFIGSNLCERLLAAGHEVVCIDNLLTGRLRNLASFQSHAGFSFLQRDVTDGLPALAGVDRVYHLASAASPPAYQKHAIETLRANSAGTENLLRLGVREGARFLYASTSEIYGDPLEHPQREEYRGNVSSTGPRSMYDEAKRFGEALTMAYCGVGADARLVRIFNTYGPRLSPNDGRMVPNFAMQALRSGPLTVYGDGSQTRSLCYVDDLVRGLIEAMECDAMTGQVVNLGSREEHTVLEYARLVVELAGSSSEIIFRAESESDDPQKRRPDITKARSILGWQPGVSLREGLMRTLDYFRAELAAGES